jgi:hypothetical protein
VFAIGSVDMNIDMKAALEVLQFVMSFGVVPLVILLWRINEKIGAVRELLFDEFAKKSDLLQTKTELVADINEAKGELRNEIQREASIHRLEAVKGQRRDG